MVHVVQDTVKDWPWLAPRTAVVAGSGLAGWQRGTAVLAARAGVPAIDLSTPNAWEAIRLALSGDGGPDVTGEAAPDMAAWFLGHATGMPAAGVSGDETA